MCRLVLLGPPASGKGTQAARLSSRFGVKSVSTGAVLREQIAMGTSLGKTAEHHLSLGELLPDDLMNGMIESWIEGNGSEFIFDGYPRTRPQAEKLDTLLNQRSIELSGIIYLRVSNDVLRRRVTGRLSCRKCNHVLQEDADQGAIIGATCSICGDGVLYRRDDDNLETFELRLEEYARKTQAVADYYAGAGRLLSIDGEGSADEVFGRILKQLS